MLKDFLTVDNVGATDENGLTLLHWAADRGFTEIAKQILKFSPGLVNKKVPVFIGSLQAFRG